MPKIAVVTVVRNAKDTIERTINSLISQHYPNLEYIVWDGKSNDGTLEILDKHNGFITTLISEKDEGPVDAFNKAIELCTADYIGYLNADDEFEPGFLWAVSDAIIKNPAAKIITAGMRITNGKRTIYLNTERDRLELTIKNILDAPIAPFMNSVIHKEIYQEIGKPNQNKSSWYYSNDLEFMVRIAATKLKSVIIPRPLVLFHMHERSISQDKSVRKNIFIERMMIADHYIKMESLEKHDINALMDWKIKQNFIYTIHLLCGFNIKDFLKEVTKSLLEYRLKWLIIGFSWLIYYGRQKIGLALSEGIRRK